MTSAAFKALLVDQANGETRAEFKNLSEEELPQGDILVKVAYSSLNYKDALAVTGRGKVVRQFPMVPGIDLVGTVAETGSPHYQQDEWVILTGCGAGEEHWGGYAELARVQGDWLVHLPGAFNPRQAMAIGTAGVTAMMSVMALEAHDCHPGQGEVVVTGASGGVGSMAVMILASLGYSVIASTGRAALRDHLMALGAADIMPRQELARGPAQPLQTGRWAGAIDTVGGDTLAALLAMMQDGGSVTSVGVAGGHTLNTTVYPFILRGVNLLGINAAHLPQTQRVEIWSRLARDLPLELMDRVMQVEPLANIFKLSEQILAGQVRGRVVLDVSDQES